VNAYWGAAIVSLWLLLVVLAVAQLGLLRKVAPLLDGHHPHDPVPAGLAVGETPGDFEAVDERGVVVGLDTLTGASALVLLSSSGCAPCERLAASLRASSDPWPVTLIVITDGDSLPDLPPWVKVLRQLDRSAARAFGTHATPYAFALDHSATVTASAIPTGVAHLRALAATATGS
jgi:hypothetical protein